MREINKIFSTKWYAFSNNTVTIRTRLQTVKVKAIPLHAWTGPEGSRRLRLPDFKTVGT
jgi:hypothetical protein